LHFFPGTGRSVSCVGISDAPLDLGFPGRFNLCLAGAVAILQELPDQPVDLAGGELARLFEDFGSGAVHGQIVARNDTGVSMLLYKIERYIVGNFLCKRNLHFAITHSESLRELATFPVFPFISGAIVLVLVEHE